MFFWRQHNSLSSGRRYHQNSFAPPAITWKNKAYRNQTCETAYIYAAQTSAHIQNFVDKTTYIYTAHTSAHIGFMSSNLQVLVPKGLPDRIYFKEEQCQQSLQIIPLDLPDRIYFKEKQGQQSLQIIPLELPDRIYLKENRASRACKS